LKALLELTTIFMKDPWKKRDLITSGKDKKTGKRNKEIL
jgi:hypothetical protein